MLTPEQRKQAVFKHHAYMSAECCLTEPTAELKLFLNDIEIAGTNAQSADLQTADCRL